MSHQNNLTTCGNCLHKTSAENNLVCLVTGKSVQAGDCCENFSAIGRDSREIDQFGFEAEKQYFSIRLFNLFATYLVGLILGTVFFMIGYSDPREHAVMIVVSVLIILVSAVVSMVLLYNLWKFTIQELNKHGLKPSVESPGKAVGYLFIPFYNFYWVFKALGKLPVDLNRIAIARTGVKVMANDIGLILSITTILSVIPVFGVVLALVNSFFIPVFYFMAINGVRNIPYSPETNCTEKKIEAEPLDRNSIRDYSQLFNREQYGINIYFGLYYFAANFLFSVVSIIILSFTYDFSITQYFQGNNLIYIVLLPLVYTAVLVIFSHAIRQKLWLAILVGLSYIIINVVPSLIMVMMDRVDSHQIFNKNYILHMGSNFLSASLFIVSISAFIRYFGLKFWSILLSLLVPAIISHLFYHTGVYMFEIKSEFQLSTLLNSLAYILVSAVGIYLAFYQYIERTKKLSRIS